MNNISQDEKTFYYPEGDDFIYFRSMNFKCILRVALQCKEE